MFMCLTPELGFAASLPRSCHRSCHVSLSFIFNHIFPHIRRAAGGGWETDVGAGEVFTSSPRRLL